jgi:hypothetical protein
MKAKQLLLLFLALLLPGCIFLFLKGFGKNEFAVPPLFQTEKPGNAASCGTDISLPYILPDTVMRALALQNDSIALVVFGQNKDEQNVSRIEEAYSGLPLRIEVADPEKNQRTMQCIYFLQEPFDAVLVDRKGQIRGQYDFSDREEVDRVITELAIIFKKY